MTESVPLPDDALTYGQVAERLRDVSRTLRDLMYDLDHVHPDTDLTAQDVIANAEAFNTFVHELYGITLQVGRGALHVVAVIPDDVASVPEAQGQAITELRCAVDELALSAADTGTACREATEASTALVAATEPAPRYDAWNPPASTAELPTRTPYEMLVERGAQDAFARWRSEHPGEQLTDGETIVRLRIQARMVVDDVASAQAAEAARWVAGGGD